MSDLERSITFWPPFMARVGVRGGPLVAGREPRRRRSGSVPLPGAGAARAPRGRGPPPVRGPEPPAVPGEVAPPCRRGALVGAGGGVRAAVRRSRPVRDPFATGPRTTRCSARTRIASSRRSLRPASLETGRIDGYRAARPQPARDRPVDAGDAARGVAEGERHHAGDLQQRPAPSECGILTAATACDKVALDFDKTRSQVVRGRSRRARPSAFALSVRGLTIDGVIPRRQACHCSNVQSLSCSLRS